MNTRFVLVKYGDRFEPVMGSDIHRGGMFLELWDKGPPRDLVLWEFYSDIDGSFELVQNRTDVPPEVAVWFREEARRRLPPVTVPPIAEVDVS